MAVNTDTAFELADLNRKLTTTRALLAYEKKCAETRLLEASEEQRLLRVRLLHLEPEYNLLLADFNNHSQYASELEEALEATNKRLSWTEISASRYNMRSKELEEKLRASAVRNKELEEKLQSKLLSEGTAQGVLAAEIEEMKSKHTTLLEENAVLKTALKASEKDSMALEEIKAQYSNLQNDNKALNGKLQTQEKEIESTKKAYTESQDRIAEMEKSHTAKVQELRAVVKSIRNETNEGTTKLREEAQALKEELTTHRETTPLLRSEIATLKEKLQDHVDRLAKALTTKASSQAALESELATLRLELDDAHSTVKRAAEEAARAAKKEAISERQLLEKELATLRLELSDAQKTAERLQSSKDTKENKAPKAELTTLTTSLKRETKLREKAEKDLARIIETNKTLETKLESARAKLALKTAPAATKIPLKDENSKKRAQPLTMEELEHSAKRVRKEGPKTSEFSITPFLKKQAAVAIDTPVTPSAEPRGVSVDPTMVDDDTAERSIMVPAVVESKEPTRILLAGAARKRKTAKNDPIPEEVVEETIEPASPEPELVPSRPKAKPRAGKKSAPVEKAKVEPSIFDSPSSLPLPVQKPKARKKKVPIAAEETFYGRGIKPTVFDEDDGTGRLVMNNSDTQEAAGPSRKVGGGKKLGGVGLGGKGGDDGLMLAPVVNAFNKDISPAKKRPDALKRLFAGKK